MRPLNRASPAVTPLKPHLRMGHVPPAAAESDLRKTLDTLVDYRWSFAAVVVAVLLGGALYAVTAAPVYRSTLVLQVEEKERLLGGLEELLTNDGPEVATEMELLSSRTLLGRTIDELHLDVVAEPRHFPVFGAAVARHYGGQGAAPARLGLDRFAWGGERLRLDRLAVPRALEDEELTLVAGRNGSYALRDEDGRTLLQGTVGAPATSAASGVPSGVSLLVSELIARPGTEFRVVKRSQLVAEEALQRALRMSERGDKTGVLSMSLEGATPEQPAAILDSISRHYVRQNVEQRSEEAEKTLKFLDTQLPALRAELDRAEKALSAYRGKTGGSVDLGLEAKAVLDRSVQLEKAISEASMERAALRNSYTENHPQVQAANARVAQLQGQRSVLESQLKRLPEAEKQSAQMVRDVKVANEAYLMLSQKAQEYRVLKSSTVANVRVLDPASVPRKPVRPNKPGVMVVSFLLGLTLGAALAYARRALNDRVLDPDAVEAGLGVPVYATVPESDEQLRHTRGWRTSAHATTLPLLARTKPDDLAVESLRSLRTSLQFALGDAPNNILAITGPSPRVGKSFVAANLACVLADAGKRILLVDADLRAGWLHRYFATRRTHGLSEVLSGTVELGAAVRSLPEPHLSFLPTGILPPNPSELLLGDRFKALLAQVSAAYDLVVVDTPPVLAVADGAIVGRHAGVNLLVVRAGAHPLREIATALGRLEQNGVQVQGVVFNAVPRAVLGRSSYGVYQYAYPGAGAPAGATP